MNYNKADFIASYGISSQLPDSDRPELSFSGRSNVGKSSVINCIVGRKNFARVGASPGKTSQINYFSVEGAGYLVDLPGYGYAKTDVSFQTKFFVQKELDIRGSRNAMPSDFRAVIHYLERGTCPVDEFISMECSAEEVPRIPKQILAPYSLLRE